MKAEGMDREVLERYVGMRKAITGHADRIVGVAHLLGLLKHCDGSIEVDANALSAVGGMIGSDACSIQETLDGFIHVPEAEEVLEEG